MNIEHISLLLLIYATPVSFGIFSVAGLWLHLKTKNLASLFFSFGASLLLVSYIKQIFFPLHRARFSENGEVIYEQGPTAIDHLFLMAGSIGMVVCAVSFIVLTINLARLKNGPF